MIGNILSQPKQNSKDTISSNAKAVAISALLTTIFATLTRMAVPRYLGVEQMGEITFAESWANMFLSIGQLGVGTWFMKHVSLRAETSRESFTSGLMIPFTLMMALIGLMNFVLFWREGNHSHVALTSIMGLFVALTILQRGILRRNCIALNFTKFVSKVEVYQKIFTGIAVILSLIWEASPLNVAIAMLLPQLWSFIYILIYLRETGNLEINGSLSRGFQIAKESLPFFAANVFVDLIGSIDVPILEHFSSKTEIGLLGASIRIQGALLMFLPVIQSSAQPELARLFATNINAFEEKAREIFRYVLLFALFIGFGMASFGGYVVKLLFGESFAAAGPSLIALGPVTILTYSAMFMGSTAMMTSKSSAVAKQMVIAIVIKLILSIYLIPIGSKYGDGFGATTTAIISGMTELVVVIGLSLALGRRIFPLRYLLHVLGSFPVCVGLGYCMEYAFGWNVWTRIPIFIVFFVTYILIGKISTWGEFKRLLRLS